MYKKIVIPLDGSELAECVIPHVLEIVRCNPADVFLCQVVTYPHYDFLLRDAGLAATLYEELEKEACIYLDNKAEPFRVMGLNVKTEVLPQQGSISDTIITYAESVGAELVAIAAHGRSGYMRWFLGTVAERIIHGSGLPVLIVHPPKE